MNDAKLNEKIQKAEKHDRKVNHVFRLILHWMERVIAVITMLVLSGSLILQCFGLIVNPAGLYDVSHMLHELLSIVVGLEFVRMLIDTTPANVIEVLVVAITRHVILTHEDPWSNLLSIACVAILFAVRRYLIRPEELKEEMVEEE